MAARGAGQGEDNDGRQATNQVVGVVFGSTVDGVVVDAEVGVGDDVGGGVVVEAGGGTVVVAVVDVDVFGGPAGTVWVATTSAT